MFVGEVLIAVVILALARRMADTTPEGRVRLDLVGTALSALGLALIVFGILRAGAWGFVQAKPGAPKWLGLSPTIWLVLGGGVVLWMFIGWENRRLTRGEEPLIDPHDPQQPDAARRPDVFLLPVPASGGTVLLRAAARL